MRHHPSVAAARSAAGLFGLQRLEPRMMLCVDGSEHVLGTQIGSFPHLDSLHPTPQPALNLSLLAGEAATPASLPLSSLPTLSSRPTATAKLVLDFDGDVTSSWGTYVPGTTPAYDQDGDATTFSSGELASIQDVWARVSEKYSPFNLDVTTVDTGNLTNKVTLKVVIGGNGLWLDGNLYGGVAYVGGFYNTNPNKVFVFSQNLGTGTPKYVAEASAHESGHGFGLQHQSTYSNGQKIAEYSSGTGTGAGSIAPILGNSYSAERGLWWYGQSSLGSNVIQDDLSILSNTNNGFGYRVDDHGATLGTATALISDGSTGVSGAGVIEKATDTDVFSFSSTAGAVSFTLGIVSNGPTLNAKIELRDAAGNLVASANNAVLGETLNATLASGGSYQLLVTSNGAYGDLGQYTIAGTISTQPPPPVTITAPTNLVAAAQSSTQINLSWLDNSSNETNFIVERSVGSPGSWQVRATLGQNSTTYNDTGLTASTTYYYRVRGTDGTIYSDYSNEHFANTQAPPQVVINAPTNLLATAQSSSQINLSWQDNSGNEANFLVERSVGTNGNWQARATLGANVTSFSDTGLSASTTYFYRVRATDGTVFSNYSNERSATTQAPPAVIPTAPTQLRVTGTTQTSVSLAWNDNSSNETGFGIERSNNGTSGWTLVTTTNSNVTTYTNTGLKKRQTYYYRVRANGTAGNSGWSNVVNGRTLNSASPGNLANGKSVFSDALQIAGGSLALGDLDDVLVG